MQSPNSLTQNGHYISEWDSDRVAPVLPIQSANTSVMVYSD
jgi:hypothetical protein